MTPSAKLLFATTLLLCLLPSNASANPPPPTALSALTVRMRPSPPQPPSPPNPFCVQNLRSALGCICYLRYISVLRPTNLAEEIELCGRAFGVTLPELSTLCATDRFGIFPIRRNLRNIRRVLRRCGGGQDTIREEFQRARPFVCRPE